MAITVKTEDFENAHKEKPRGHGYWVFVGDDPDKAFNHRGVGMYSEVKKAAIASYKRVMGTNFGVIKVAP